MQPKMCTKCKKNVAVIFVSRVENGVTMNEGFCLKCAKSLGIPQIDQAVRQMGISEEDLEAINDEMSSMFGQSEPEGEEDETERQGKELAKAIRSFLDALPGREQDIFLRRYFFVEESTVIAQRYGMKPRSMDIVRSRYFSSSAGAPALTMALRRSA